MLILLLFALERILWIVFKASMQNLIFWYVLLWLMIKTLVTNKKNY